MARRRTNISMKSTIKRELSDGSDKSLNSPKSEKILNTISKKCIFQY
jgi:hypothetical protein